MVDTMKSFILTIRRAGGVLELQCSCQMMLLDVININEKNPLLQIELCQIEIGRIHWTTHHIKWPQPLQG